jgi:integrase/recombinase XerD
MRYKFSKGVELRLKGFKIYLQELGNGVDTIRQKSNYVGYFLTWLESENLQAEETTYNDMLSFIDYCNLEGSSKRHINSKLRSIRYFYEHLKKQYPNIINPAVNLVLKGVRQKLPSNIINYAELEKLYNSYKTNDNRDKRNKVILGLLVYQGLTTEELHQLEPEHLKLKQGKIYVPGNRRRNSRILDLQPCQILELYKYQNKIRPKLNCKNSSQLFVSMEGNNNLKNSLHHMFRAIKKDNPGILHPKQIRSSIITHWLKDNNLRQVQYMAGHKYVSSTERYQLNNLFKLQSKVNEYHPLNGNQN